MHWILLQTLRFLGALGLLSVAPSELESTAAEIEQHDGEALTLAADVADAGDTKEAVDRKAEQFGRLEIVIANAGIDGVWAPINALEPAHYPQVRLAG
jgi:NADP-dependent 3-hydroxy acid dehydrogenase YdfG